MQCLNVYFFCSCSTFFNNNCPLHKRVAFLLEVDSLQQADITTIPRELFNVISMDTQAKLSVIIWSLISQDFLQNNLPLPQNCLERSEVAAKKRKK